MDLDTLIEECESSLAQRSRLSAKAKAKSKWLPEYEKQRKDPIKRHQQVRAAQGRYRDKKRTEHEQLTVRLRELEAQLGDDHHERYLLQTKFENLKSANSGLRSSLLVSGSSLEQGGHLFIPSQLSLMQPCGVCQESQTVVHQMELQAQVLRAKAASLSSNIQDLVAPPKTPTLATLSREAGLSAVSSPACSVLSTSSSSGSGSVAADDTIQSSFKLFGPLLGSDMAIQKLKALPSLRNSCNVDTAIGLYRELSYVTNKRTLRKYFLKMLSTRYAMFDSCNVLDRSKAVEIVYMLGQQNKRHSTHFFSFVHEMGSADDIGLSTSMTASDKAIVMLSIQTFISSIKQLPSLFGADTLIQELEQALVAVTENAGNRPLFYKTIELINQAEDICDSADRIKYVISLEIMRATTRSHVEKHMLQSAQDEFDEE